MIEEQPHAGEIWKLKEDVPYREEAIENFGEKATIKVMYEGGNGAETFYQTEKLNNGSICATWLFKKIYERDEDE